MESLTKPNSIKLGSRRRLLRVVDANIGIELLHGPANDGLFGIGGVEVMFDVDSLDLTLLRESLRLARC